MMPRFTEKEKQVRKAIMDPVLAGHPCPRVAEIAEENSITMGEVDEILKNLEQSVCIARQNESHAGMEYFQDEKLDVQAPELGEIFYARPFATFKNHYPITVNGKQKWYGECAVEVCAVSNMFPGMEVVVDSICRQTKEPVELVMRDGAITHYSPRTMRVHIGIPLRYFFDDIVGWCDYNSYFSSEEAVEEWRKAHPDVKGITRSPEEISLLVDEVIGSRLDYDYQLTFPILRTLLNLKRYGLTKPLQSLGGLPVPDQFWLPTPHVIKEMKRKGYGMYIRFSLF
jgi:hypothetical protein